MVGATDHGELTGIQSLQVGKIYRRRDIHVALGGSWQSGISPSARLPVVLLFSGESGARYGYNDGWSVSDIYRYSGEGQTGDMEFSRGNKAIRDHQRRGMSLQLFHSLGNGQVRYIGEFEYVGHRLLSKVRDREDQLRSVIEFDLSPVGRVYRETRPTDMH